MTVDRVAERDDQQQARRIAELRQRDEKAELGRRAPEAARDRGEQRLRVVDVADDDAARAGEQQRHAAGEGRMGVVMRFHDREKTAAPAGGTGPPAARGDGNRGRRRRIGGEPMRAGRIAAGPGSGGRRIVVRRAEAGRARASRSGAVTAAMHGNGRAYDAGVEP